MSFLVGDVGMTASVRGSLRPQHTLGSRRSFHRCPRGSFDRSGLRRLSAIAALACPLGSATGDRTCSTPGAGRGQSDRARRELDVDRATFAITPVCRWPSVMGIHRRSVFRVPYAARDRRLYRCWRRADSSGSVLQFDGPASVDPRLAEKKSMAGSFLRLRSWPSSTM